MWTAIERGCVFIQRDDTSAGHARPDLREYEKFIARAQAALKTDFSRCARTKRESPYERRAERTFYVFYMSYILSFRTIRTFQFRVVLLIALLIATLYVINRHR
jgi:hypothetical protein